MFASDKNCKFVRFASDCGTVPTRSLSLSSSSDCSAVRLPIDAGMVDARLFDDRSSHARSVECPREGGMTPDNRPNGGVPAVREPPASMSCPKVVMFPRLGGTLRKKIGGGGGMISGLVLSWDQ